MKRSEEGAVPAGARLPSPRVPAALVCKYDVPGPRYTSYPPATLFTTGFGEADYRVCLAAASQRKSEPLSLYVHLPFCEQRCWFCGCNAIVTDHRETIDAYLERLERETALLAEALGERRRLSQYHWGGGTPTYLAPSQMERLQRAVLAHFVLAEDAEVAVELDPRTSTPERLEALRRMRFNRVSLGVQDFDSDVQAAVHRHQPLAMTQAVYNRCRALGFASVNVDLIYGLPRQTPARFATTLDRIVEMRPDRLALYSYAHVPWIRAHQKKIREEELPPPPVKLALFELARERLLAAGYVQIGMDHFALPEDELARARYEGRLTRNFMGYTVSRGTDMVGLGITAIGDVGGAYVQNAHKLSVHARALAAGRLPLERGYKRTVDDEIRREVITALMCNFRLDSVAVAARFGIDFERYFAPELRELERGPAADGLVRLEGSRIELTALGERFVRNVCMIFDRYLPSLGSRPAYSRTV